MAQGRMPLLQGHDVLISKMRHLGYRANKAGVCYGFALMAAQAILQGNLDSFINTLHFITSSDDNLSDHPAFTSDILPLLDGIQIYQSGDKCHYHLLDMNTRKYIHRLADIVSTCDIIAKGGIHHLNTDVGIYSLLELEAHLAAHRKTLLHVENNLPHAMILQSINHAVCVYYDFQQRHWVLIDANLSSPLALSSDRDLAIHLARSLGHMHEMSIIAMSTTMLTIGNHRHQLARQIHKLHTSDEFIFANSVTASKAYLHDTANNSTLLQHAFQNKKYRLAKKLLLLGTNPNDDRVNGTKSLLYSAIEWHDLLMIRMLLHHQADPNLGNMGNSQKRSESPLHLAVRKGYTDVVRLLLQHNADPTLKLSLKQHSPLNIARKYKHTDIVTLLEKAEEQWPVKKMWNSARMFSPMDAVNRRRLSNEINTTQINGYHGSVWVRS